MSAQGGCNPASLRVEPACRRRCRWAAWAIGWLSVMALPAVVDAEVLVAYGPPDPPQRPATSTAVKPFAAERRLQDAAARLEGLQRLQQAAAQAQAEVRSLERGVRDLQHRAAQCTAVQASASTTIEALPACHGAAEAAAQHWSAQALAMREAQAASRRAVQGVTAAGVAAVATAARRSDAGFALRLAAEQVLAVATVQLAAQRSTCRQLAEQASAAAHDADAQVLALRRAADALPGRVDAVRQLWTRAGEQASVAEQQGWLPGAGRAGADLRSRGAVEALKAAAGAPPNATGNTEIRAPARIAIPSAEGVVESLDRRALVDDAAAMLQSLVEGCRSTNAPGCSGLQQQQAEMAARRRDLDSRIASQQRGLLEAADGAPAEVDGLRTAADIRQPWLLAIARDLPAALAEAAFVAAQAQQAAAALQARVDPAVGAAERALAEAFRVARGEPLPGRSGSGAMASPAGPPRPAAAPPPSMQLPQLPMLAGHAYEFFARWNSEGRGFGAYTYVLLRSASDLRKPEVLLRWRALLDVVLRERAGTAVPGAEAPFVNLFCIPGTRPPGLAERADGIADAFADELALALLFRAQSGLLTRPEIQSRLRASSGPFLITLPVRIADAASDTPLLFADLGAYPVDAVADLATHYKGALLADFPARQLAWKPPVVQRVALVMIGLASDVGGLFTSVLPTAVAGGR